MSKKTKTKTKKGAFRLRKRPQVVLTKTKTKKISFPKIETKTLFFIGLAFIFSLFIAHSLELELWPRWIYWDDVASFVTTLILILSGFVILFLFYELIKKNKESILSKIFLHFKEKSSEPLFGNERPDGSIISAMIYYFVVVPLLIIFIPLLILGLILGLISLVVSILLATPFFDRTIESRDFMVIEQRYESKTKGKNCYKTVFEEINGTLKADICNKEFYHQVNTGSHLKITGTNTLFGFAYKIKDIEVLKD
jgi:hypothetical protein